MSVRRLPSYPFFLPMASCPRRCVYCHQGEITGVDESLSPASVRDALSSLTVPHEVCFFGGSFTCFPGELREAYLDAVLSAPPGSSVRFSTHPRCLSPDVLDELRHRQISMIEIGVSSLDDDVLSACNRGYTGRFVLSVMGAIMERGYPLGVQLMIGLPGQSGESELEDLKRIASLFEGKESPAVTLRLYPCLVLEGTPLASAMRRGEYTPLTLEEAALRAGESLLEARKLGFAVQRIGLHETDSLSKSVIAGPHHPAFGEMARSVALINTLLDASPDGPWYVEKKDTSLLLGHGCFGLSRMSEKTGLPHSRLKEKIIFRTAYDN